MLPPHLESTLALLQRAFPHGAEEADYLPLIEHLYNHLSDENLELVLSQFFEKSPGVIANDILRVGSRSYSTSLRHDAVGARLAAAGFAEWAAAP
jgi:hypothetical protein